MPLKGVGSREFRSAIKYQAVLTVIIAMSSLVSSLLLWKVPEEVVRVGPMRETPFE